MKILANDGISQSGITALENAGYQVETVKVAQDQLENYINQNNIDILLVRSATKVRKDLIDATHLKLIGRGGVGLDNIDVAYAESKGIAVINTPAASSRSVAEMVFGHIFSGIRFLKDANQEMPLEGESRFKELKKSYSKATELQGKTIGIIGFGRIGKEVAKIGFGLGMRVIASTQNPGKETLTVSFYDGQSIDFIVKKVKLNELLSQSDIITLHVPAQKKYTIGEKEIEKMKPGSAIINTARGGVLDEVALVKALDNGKLAFAGLDVFEKEPNPEIQLLMHPGISLSPHIAGSTLEAQDRIGIELAEQIIERFGKNKKTYLLLFFSCCIFSGITAQTQTGKASFYADFFEGRLTANGEVYSHQFKTAAHKTLPFGTYVKVTNLKNKKAVQVIVNDRGPFVKGRIIDLTQTVAKELGFIDQGVTPVEVQVIGYQENPAISQLSIHKKEFQLAFEVQKSALARKKKEAIKNFKMKELDLQTAQKIMDIFEVEEELISKNIALQIGAYSKKEKALDIAKEFLLHTEKAVLIKDKLVGRKTLFLVFVANFTTLQEAENFKATILIKYPGSFIVNLNKIENPNGEIEEKMGN